MSEAYYFSVFDVVSQSYRGFIRAEAEHAALVGQFCQQKLVELARFGFQSKFTQNERIAKNVVQMQMSIQQMLYCQLVVGNILFQHLLLFRKKTAGIYDCSFPCFVGNNVTVYGKHIKFKSLYFHDYLTLRIYLFIRSHIPLSLSGRILP